MRLLERAAAHVEHEDPEAWATTVGAAGDRPARQRSRRRGARPPSPRRCWRCPPEPARAVDPPAAKSSAARSVPCVGDPRRPARRPGTAPVRRRSARRAGGPARAGARRVHPVARPPGLRALGARHVRGGVPPGRGPRRPAGRWPTRSSRPSGSPTTGATTHRSLERTQLVPSSWRDAVGDPDLLIDAEFAVLRTLRATALKEAGEDMLVRLEARRDPVRLKEHCFWMMWVYLGAAEFERCVDDLRSRAWSSPLSSGRRRCSTDRSRRSRSLEAGGSTRSRTPSPRRSPTTTTRSDTRIARLARTEYLATVGALEQAAGEGVAAFHEATLVSRPLDAALVGQPAHVGARPARTSGAAGSVLACRTSSTPARSTARCRLAPRSSWPPVAPASARDMLEPTLATLVGGGRIRELLDGQLLHATAALADGDAAGAIGECRTALATALDHGYATIAWRLRVVLALAAEATGDAATATEQRSQAVAEFARAARPHHRPGVAHRLRAGQSPGRIRSGELIAHLAEHRPQRLHPRLAGPVVAQHQPIGREAAADPGDHVHRDERAAEPTPVERASGSAPGTPRCAARTRARSGTVRTSRRPRSSARAPLRRSSPG